MKVKRHEQKKVYSSTREVAAHPKIVARRLTEADIRSLAKSGVLPHSVVAGKFVFKLDEVLGALDALRSSVLGALDALRSSAAGSPTPPSSS